MAKENDNSYQFDRVDKATFIPLPGLIHPHIYASSHYTVFHIVEKIWSFPSFDVLLWK